MQQEIPDDESIDGSTAELLRRVENHAGARQRRRVIIYLMAAFALAVLVVVCVATALELPNIVIVIDREALYII